ncbi:MAG: ABC transporter permease [Verrucomicrobiia bacterium]
MNLWIGIKEGFREIAAHKFRSLLTISGIVLGVASLLAMFALTEGMARQFRQSLISHGGVERFSIRPTEVPPEQEDFKDISPGITRADVIAIRRYAPLIQKVSGEVRIPGNATLTYGTRSFDTNFVRGVDPDQLHLDNMQLRSGRFLSDLDIDHAHRVAVLGPSPTRSLFPDGENPLGQTIFINGIDFTVIGTTSSSADHWRANRVFIPITTAQFHFKPSQNGEPPDLRLDGITVEVRDLRSFDTAIEQLRNILQQTHRGIIDFGFNTREDWFDAIERGVRGARISGGLIAAVSLLAGGVGITNIMLASIKERTRELGVRRALGARPRDLFLQITIESSLLATLGALLGLATGLGLIYLLTFISPAESPPILLPHAALISFSAGSLVGFCAGLIPAWRASRLHPIEALRYE